MTDPHDSTAHPRSEDDHVESRTVVLVGVGALVTFTAAALLAMAYLRHASGLRPAPPLPPELGQSKIALVEQSLFFDGNRLRGEKDRAARQARLQGTGWVDRGAGLAHIPIEEAMALVAAGARPGRLEALPAPPRGAARGGVDAPSVPIGGASPAAPAAPAGKGGGR